MEDILYLEPDEEITSVIDKLKAVPGGSVALVLPKDASLAKSVVNLRLLEREATRLKKHIGLVTQDPVGMKLASHVGIPVYASATDLDPIAPDVGQKPQLDDVIELEESEAPTKATAVSPSVPVRRYDDHTPAAKVQPSVAKIPTKTPQPVPRNPTAKDRSLTSKRWLVTMTGLILVALIVGAYWFFVLYPRATATLTLKSESFEQSVKINVDNSATTIDSAAGTIPGQKLETQADANDSFSATGKKEVGTKASGTVQIQNKLGEAVQIAAGASFSRGDTVFTSTKAVTVPAAAVSLSAGGDPVITPGKSSVSVEAEQPGSQYNLVSGTLTISGLSSAQSGKVSASNAEAFTGGESKTVAVVTDSDIDRAKNALIDAKRQELTDALQKQSGDKTMMDGTVSIEVVSSTPSKQSGDEADSFDLEATLRARTISFASSDLQEAVAALVKTKLPDNRELVLDQSKDTLETTVDSLDFGKGLLVVNATLKTKVVATMDQESLKQLIAGKTATEAENVLKDQAGVLDTHVDLRPTLRQTVPSSLSHITLILQSSE